MSLRHSDDASGPPSERGFSNRGRGNHGWRPRQRVPKLEPWIPSAPASEPPPLGDILQIIKRSDLNESSDGYCGITDAAVIASYNWIDAAVPRIMIPGRPPLWTPLPAPQKLREDDGVYYRDVNSAWYSDHPLQPAIISVMKMNPQIRDRKVDVFACGSTVGNLLRFIQGFKHPFRMLVEVVGKTVHLIRRENSPQEQLVGVKGYGHTFPEAYTTWEKDVKGSKSHQRILKYRFNGLDMMIRFEGDGYVKGDEDAEPQLPRESDADQQDDPLGLDDVGLLKIREEIEPASSQEGLEIVDGGRLVPRDAIFDLKTRGAYAKATRNTLGEELPRLWVSQIDKFVLAYHTYGRFDDVEVQDVRQTVQDWEALQQSDLKCLSNLLRHIIQDRLDECPDVDIEIVRHEGADTLEIRKRLPDAGIPFSEGIRREWNDWLDGKNRDGMEEDGSVENAGEEEDDDDDDEDFTECDEDCSYCGKPRRH